MKIRKTAAAVILSTKGKIAVVNQHHRTWSLPKGGVDKGEETISAAIREAKEETGLKRLKYICDLGVYRRHRTPLDGSLEDTSEIKEIFVYLFRSEETKLSPEDPDNPEARWVDIDDVASLLTHEKDKKFFKLQIPRIQQELY